MHIYHFKMETKGNPDPESVNLESQSESFDLSNNCIANVFPVCVTFCCCTLFLFLVCFMFANWY